jgi:hypothetical protein
MKLLPSYSLATGLKIGKQFLAEKYFPLPKESHYVLLHASSGMASKNYPYYGEVISVLGPLLEQNGITIYQIGGKEDRPVPGCIHLMGQTSLHQTNYLIKRAIILIGNDSWSQHRAGYLNIPTVTPFGPTTSANHFAYQHHPVSIPIESHRWNRNPTFSNQEPESTIGLISPEEVINSVLKILGASITLNRKSLLIGHRFNQQMLEYVPDAPLSPEFAKGSPIMARLDLGGDEQNLFQTLQGRKLHILTKTPINPNGLVQLKANIETLTIEFTRNGPITTDYIKTLKSIGIKLQCFTLELDGDELSRKRLEFFDYCQIVKATHKSKDNFIQDARKYLNDPQFNLEIKPSTWFKSNKFILARGKIYLSKFHYLANLPTEDFSKNVSQAPDHEEFWREQDHWYVFEQEIKT